jgi:hypothetical protein
LCLKNLPEQILVCHKCRLWQGAQNAVPGEGTANAKVMFVWQNPITEGDTVFLETVHLSTAIRFPKMQERFEKEIAPLAAWLRSGFCDKDFS